MDRILEDFSILLARIPNNSLEIMGIFNKRNLFAVWELSSLQWWWCLVRQHPVFWFLSDWKLLPLLSTFPENPTFIKLITFGTSSFLLLDMLIAFDKEHLKIQVLTQNLWKSEWQLECGRWETRQAWRLPSAAGITRLHCFVKKHHIHTNTQIHFTFQLFQSWEHSY